MKTVHRCLPVTSIPTKCRPRPRRCTCLCHVNCPPLWSCGPLDYLSKFMQSALNTLACKCQKCPHRVCAQRDSSSTGLHVRRNYDTDIVAIHRSTFSRFRFQLYMCKRPAGTCAPVAHSRLHMRTLPARAEHAICYICNLIYTCR